MIFPLRPHPSAVHAIEGGRRVELRVVDGHVSADGAVISRFSQKRDGQPCIPRQKPRVEAHLGGEGMNGDVRRMGRQNRPLFIDGQAVRILDVDFLMVADRMARGLVVFLKKAGDSPRPAMEAGGCAFPVNFRVVFGDVDAAVSREGRDVPDVQLRNEVRPLRLRAEKIGFQRPVMSLPRAATTRLIS